MIHGLSSGIISYFRGGSFRAGFYSGLGSAFDVGTEGYGKMLGRTAIMAIIGGTFAKLGGGKFANGAMSAAFTHLFNAEIHFSISRTAGAGYGETKERGIAISHDSTKPWYKGWQIGGYVTEGKGAYTGLDASAEMTAGGSWNDTIMALDGEAVTAGGTSDIPGLNFLSGGPEVILSSKYKPIYNLSAGASANPTVPFETHLFRTNTKVTIWAEN